MKTKAMQWVARRMVVFVLMVVSVCIGARWVCGYEASGFFDGDATLQHELAAGQARWVRAPLSYDDFKTGIDLFDGEWLFGTYMMSAMGLGQVALEHPELARVELPVIETCLNRLLSPKVRAFDTDAWDEDALATLQHGRGHAAYLGYLNLALGIHRTLSPTSRFADMHDRITAALTKRIASSSSGLIETYPHEAYPVDTIAAVASIAQHARATGMPPPAFVATWIRNIRTRYIAPDTGLLVQAASHETGAPLDRARGSGTALAAYFASFIDAALARDLHVAVRRQLATAPLGFGLVREYTDDIHGHGDIDSGPLLWGYSISATGFSLGSARATSDRDHFVHIFRTARLFGALHNQDDAKEFVSGGPLGNAIMLAMLTARPVSPTTNGAQQ